MTDLVYKGKKRRKTVKVARYVRDLSRDDLLISSSDRATTESESDTTTAASSFSSAVTVTPLSSERELSLSNAPSCREVLTSGSNVVHDGDNIQHGRGKTPSDGRWRNKKEINEGNEARSLISRPLGEYERANSFQMITTGIDHDGMVKVRARQMMERERYRACMESAHEDTPEDDDFLSCDDEDEDFLDAFNDSDEEGNDSDNDNNQKDEAEDTTRGQNFLAATLADVPKKRSFQYVVLGEKMESSEEMRSPSVIKVEESDGSALAVSSSMVFEEDYDLQQFQDYGDLLIGVWQYTRCPKRLREKYHFTKAQTKIENFYELQKKMNAGDSFQLLGKMVGAGLAKYYMAIDVNFSRGQIHLLPHCALDVKGLTSFKRLRKHMTATLNSVVRVQSESFGNVNLLATWDAVEECLVVALTKQHSVHSTSIEYKFFLEPEGLLQTFELFEFPQKYTNKTNVATSVLRGGFFNKRAKNIQRRKYRLDAL